MADLVQIDIPPLRQSTAEIMACPRFYIESIIKGHKLPGGLESARGKQVHSVLSRYASWCAAKGIAQDLSAFDSLARGVGPQAERILTGLRDGYAVDHAHFLASEIPMSLDEHFRPTNVAINLEEFCEDSGLPAWYEGTLDAVYVFRDEQAIDIHDAKSHMKPFDPDQTLQGRMYSLLCFQHFRWVQQVRFRLVFVRYRNLHREVIYHRSDVPTLIEIVKAARHRQEAIHQDYAATRDIEAISGSQCVYCPLLSNRECPISEFNPAMQLSPVDRLKFSLWYSAFSRINNAALKDVVQGSGKPVVLKDYNGKSYVYGATEKESNVYPLFQATDDGIAMDRDGNPVMPIASLLMDYANMPDNENDRAWLGKLTISSTKLEGYLKTNKRVFLHQAVQDTAEKITKVTLKVSKPLDAVDVPEEENEDDEWPDDF
jgi:hypothetical protein